MNAEWAAVTGNYYVPGPEQTPNVLAAFLSGFLAMKTPTAMEVFKARLAATNPYAQYEMLAKLADIQERYEESLSANQRATTQASALEKTALAEALSGAFDLAKVQMQTAADASKANQAADLERVKAATVTTPMGHEVVKEAQAHLASVLRTYRNGQDWQGAAQQAFRQIQSSIGLIADPTERLAVGRAVADFVQSQVPMFEDNPDAVAWYTGQSRQVFGTSSPIGAVRDASGASPIDINQIIQQVMSVLGGIPPATPVTPSVPTPATVPSGPSPLPSATPSASSSSPSGSTGGAVSTSVTGPPAGATQALINQAYAAAGTPISSALGGFGEPLPPIAIQQAYQRALAARHPVAGQVAAVAPPPVPRVPTPVPQAVAPPSAAPPPGLTWYGAPGQPTAPAWATQQPTRAAVRKPDVANAPPKPRVKPPTPSPSPLGAAPVTSTAPVETPNEAYRRVLDDLEKQFDAALARSDFTLADSIANQMQQLVP